MVLGGEVLTYFVIGKSWLDIMVEITDLFDSARDRSGADLHSHAGSLPRSHDLSPPSASGIPGETKVAELLASERGEYIRTLSLGQFLRALEKLAAHPAEGVDLSPPEESSIAMPAVSAREPEPMPEGGLFDSLAGATTMGILDAEQLAEMERVLLGSDSDDSSESENAENIDSSAGADRGAVSSASDQERLYRAILDSLGGGPKTIGQLSKSIAVDTVELRGYLQWMQRMGKVSRSGRARATRYRLAEQ